MQSVHPWVHVNVCAKFEVIPWNGMTCCTSWSKGIDNSLCGTTCACCSVTPDRRDSAWRCGCQAAEKTARKPGKVISAQSGKEVGTVKTWLSIQKGYGGNFNDICKHTCMAAVNWAAFSMVSSEAPLWTVVKIEVLKKYLQFWWSIWYNNSNISALTSGEDCFKKTKTCSDHLLCNKSDECQSISNYITTKCLMILLFSTDQIWII